MFTGIVETMGTVETVQANRISIRTPWNREEISLGQSISVHGCCLTVTNIQDSTLTFDLSEETLAKTWFANLKPDQALNLERAMAIGGRLDGHWVTGHVDTSGVIQQISSSSDGTSKIFSIRCPKTHSMNLVPKGSVCVDGVSLTVNDVNDAGFTVSIIPYTLEHTCFSRLKVNDSVNIEFDLIGKYLMNYLEHHRKSLETSHVEKN